MPENAMTTRRASELRFPASLYSKQPMPDRYFCWFTNEQVGYFSSGVQNGNFEMCASSPSASYAAVGGLGHTLPNPLSPNSTQYSTGFANLLNNPVTATGIYANFRVWRCKAEVATVTSSASDQVYMALTAVAGAAAAYSGYGTASQGPNCAVADYAPGSSAKSGIVSADISIPAILGLSKDAFAALAGTYGVWGTLPQAPVFLEYFFQTQDQANLAAKLTVRSRIQYFVELFQRVDSLLVE